MAMTNEQRLEKVIAAIERGEAMGLIYNVDWKDTKDLFNRVLETRYRECWQCSDQLREYRQKSYNYTSPEADWKWPITTTVTGTRKVLAKDRKKTWDERINVEVHAQIEAADAFLAEMEPIAHRLIALKDKVVKGRKPSETPRDTPERTLEDTGTCAVCGKNVKMERGTKMYHHGFELKWNSRWGTCIGVGCDPIEISTEGLVKYKAALEQNLTSKQNYQARLPEITSLMVDAHPKPRTVQKGDPDWQRVYEAEGRQVEWEIKSISEALVRTKRRIAEWTPQPLPEEQAKLIASR